MNTKLIALAVLTLAVPAYAQTSKNISETSSAQTAHQSQAVNQTVSQPINQSSALLAKFDRQDYQRRIGAQIAHWDADLKAWQEKTKTATAEAKAEYEKQMAELRPKLERARVKFAQLSVASTEAFEDLRHGFENAYVDLSAAFMKMHGAIELAASKLKTANDAPVDANAPNTGATNQDVSIPPNVNQTIQNESTVPAQPL